MKTDEYCRPEVRVFARAMEDRLRANDSKGGWQDMQFDEIVDRIDDEVLELREAASFQDRIHEAADVACFAMLVADQAHRTLLIGDQPTLEGDEDENIPGG